MSKKLSTEEFIEKAKLIHGDKYDYSKVEYILSTKIITIICKLHGEFKQKPANHLFGQGCKKCDLENKRNLYAFNKNDFIKKAKEVHGDVYDYSKVEYINANTKVIITCSKHGDFEQTPASHIHAKSICKKCYLENPNSPRKLNTDIFITRANKVHNELYDYSLFKYINCDTNGTVICKIHGEFYCTPTNHINGKTGCPKCNFSKGEQKIASWLDGEHIKYKSQHKFLGCKNIKPLYFDFYLLNLNICIEFDGIQHYIPQSFSRDKTDEYKNNKFKQLTTNDNIKDEYCKNNNIRLIRIPYWDYDNIDTILKELLTKN